MAARFLSWLRVGGVFLLDRIEFAEEEGADRFEIGFRGIAKASGLDGDAGDAGDAESKAGRIALLIEETNEGERRAPISAFSPWSAAAPCSVRRRPWPIKAS
ncbi:MAG: hypothetical protein U0031_22195 [Thermomicrobiales bacterium]